MIINDRKVNIIVNIIWEKKRFKKIINVNYMLRAEKCSPINTLLKYLKITF